MRPFERTGGFGSMASSLMMGAGSGADGGCRTSMWSLAAIAPTAALAGGIFFGMLAAISMKSAGGWQRPWHLGTAILLKCVSIICIAEVLAHVELSVEWSMFTIFELMGAIAAGVILYGEELGVLKIVGITTAVVGIIMLGQPSDTPAPNAEAAVKGCEVTINMLVLFLIFTVLVLSMWVATRFPGDDTSGWRRLLSLGMGQPDEPAARGAVSAPKMALDDSRVVKLGSAGAVQSLSSTGQSRCWRLALSCWWLLVAAVLQIWVAFFLKESRGFSSMKYLGLSCLVTSVAVVAMSLALQYGTLSAASTIESGLEYLGVVLVAAVYFSEPMDKGRVAGILCTVLGMSFLVGEE